eukprot:8634675-Ditylum_brightwellii.AAC.1
MGNLSEDDIQVIEAAVMKRTEAKTVRDFNLADTIRDGLQNRYGVTIDDRSREWHLSGIEEYVRASDSLPLSEETEEVLSYVDKRLEERRLAKKSRDFDVADSIRDELYDSYFIVIDDRTKEWSVEDHGQSS